MRFYVGVTDNSWFNSLADLQPDEVNFWQPSGRSTFRAIQPGEPFLFKLHFPLHYITGGGFFVRHSVLPLSLAWQAFEQKNGAENFESFKEIVVSHLHNRTHIIPDPTIGCIILTEPFFFQNHDWISAPADWSRNIVQGKTYDTNDVSGAALWEEVQERLARNRESVRIGADVAAEEKALYGAEYVTRARLGQGSFRVLVTEAYDRKCAITQERTLPVLDAAHIKPYTRSGPHRINNGILLRTDLHKLLDLGYMTLTTDFRVEVSKRIKEEYENGRDYYALHGRELNPPSDALYLPAREYIEWHNQEVYRS